MADFNRAVSKTLIREGGAKITNDPTDKGGLTKYGIAQASHPNVDIRNLTEEQAKVIYKDGYWNGIKGDQLINQEIAEALFDTAVNMGPRMAVKLAQQALEVPDDGGLGPVTLAALNEAGGNYNLAHAFLSDYKLAKIARYVDICKKDDSQRRFLVGWISRTLES